MKPDCKWDEIEPYSIFIGSKAHAFPLEEYLGLIIAGKYKQSLHDED